MCRVTLCLPDELAQDLAHEAAERGLPRAGIIRRPLGEYLGRRERARFIGEHARAAALGYADAKLRHEAIALAEEALGSGNEALERAEPAGSDREGGWWR
jgi:hypothetical protein